jgi:nucleoside-diphosphate-sugar epimerase
LVRQLGDDGVEVVAAIGPLQNELEAGRVRDLKLHQVRILECDLRREEPLSEVPTDWDTLFHLAAYVRTEEDSPLVQVNDRGTARLLRQVPVANKRVVFTSTLAVADNARAGRITRDTICMPRTAYGRSKLAAESIVRAECEAHAAVYTILRLPTLYGLGYRPGGMFDVLPRQLAANDRLARLAWPGKMALLAVGDCAQLLIRAAVHEETKNRTFLASSNENPATWEIAEAIARAIGVPYHALPLPAPCAALLRALLGPWWQAPVVPYALQINAWRARLLLDGLYCDGVEVAQLLGLTFQDWRRGIERAYAGPRESGSFARPMRRGERDP